ncbi:MULTISPECIES: C39 family peptidase [unclassified Nocardioides]|uniref:C39 family peptidase n=1 Tax=unclassified Nocardioides TaxID=2615069 RepID=UPI0009F03D92|nr:MULTISPECIES: C39 family peptidase [unclassified Nocardioides]GAW52026.1 uncharacterized protein (Precursor) [Nocardioides sp. PD653-B2]GAW56368.1 uncharacterized protein (Precursor) [Nocardioides sp. PD653]
MHRPRPRTIAIGALVLLLAAAPFIPRGDDDEGFTPSGDGKYGALGTSTTAGFSKVTPAMQAEIDRVVDAGGALGRTSGKQTPEQLAAGLVRCAEFEGQRYCLGTGWTEDTQQQVQARMATAARTVAARRGPVVTTGDLDARAALARMARMSPTARAAAERAELTMAARSVAKVWLLRHEIEGVALPANFLADHPEARAVATAPAAKPTTTPPPNTASPSKSPSPTRSPSKSPTRTPSKTPTATSSANPGPVKTQADYPGRSAILDIKQVAEQTRTYWCGPTAMQMIAWGWRNRKQSQGHWAQQLGTTTSGTSIYDMVRVVNKSTGWDGKDHAGPYVVLDIGKYSFTQWELLMMRHIHDYQAPVVLHPILLKQFYPYLDDDASGHFQVGRGYAKNGDKPDALSYFEPWNQHRFDPSEPTIARVQWRSAYKSYRGNQAHYAHNVGV